MAEFSLVDVLTFGSASGVIAGIVNQGIGMLRDSIGRRHITTAQVEERIHAADLRREAAHADAREEFVRQAMTVRDWVEGDFIDRFAMDVDYHGGNRHRRKVDNVADALAALNEIAIRHPTSSVRSAARALEHSIDSKVNMIQGGYPDEPGDQDLRNWMDEVDELIEAIHLPPMPDEQPQKIRWSNDVDTPRIR